MLASSLGAYRIVRRLAIGGMAEILLGFRDGSPEPVAIKKILPELAAKPEFVEMFRSEAELCARLVHPNIVRTYEQDDVSYYAMEYVRGKDLRGVLADAVSCGEPIPLAQIVQLGHAIAVALDYVHAVGVVHRDVSPSNIMISYDGTPKLIDFGIAKPTTTDATRTIAIKGKLAYMSPEQARGLRLDHRSDVFSLGIVLWEMIATRRLFQADNDLATIDRILTAKLSPPSRYRPDAPAELDRIVLKALSRRRRDRYQTAGELQLDLESLAHSLELSLSPSELGAFMIDRFGRASGDSRSDRADASPSFERPDLAALDASPAPGPFAEPTARLQMVAPAMVAADARPRPVPSMALYVSAAFPACTIDPQPRFTPVSATRTTSRSFTHRAWLASMAVAISAGYVGACRVRHLLDDSAPLYVHAPEVSATVPSPAVADSSTRELPPHSDPPTPRASEPAGPIAPTDDERRESAPPNPIETPPAPQRDVTASTPIETRPAPRREVTASGPARRPSRRAVARTRDRPRPTRSPVRAVDPALDRPFDPDAPLPP